VGETDWWVAGVNGAGRARPSGALDGSGGYRARSGLAPDGLGEGGFATFAATRNQAPSAILDLLDGTPRLAASLMYGSGLRLMERLRLRVKDAIRAAGVAQRAGWHTMRFQLCNPFACWRFRHPDHSGTSRAQRRQNTIICTHVLNRDPHGVASPLDQV
jgi:hypothetical protein